MYGTGNRRRGWVTRLEVLIAIVILAVVMALMLPAIQKRRESARRMQCASNLKQIGLALHNYADTNKVFLPAIINSPESVSAMKAEAYTRNLGTTGWVLLLPQLGRRPLGDYNYNFNVSATASKANGAMPVGTAAEIAANQQFTSQVLSVFACPADVVPGLANVPLGMGPNATSGACTNARKCNYLFAAGGQINPASAESMEVPDQGGGSPVKDENGRILLYNEAAPVYSALFRLGSTAMGMFGHDGAMTFGSTTDGLSTMIMVGETLQDHAPPPVGYPLTPPLYNCPAENPDCTAVVWGQGKIFGQMAVVDGLGVRGGTSMTRINAPRTPGTDAHGKVYPGVLSSEHRGGVNVVMGDGAVRFLNQQIDLAIYTTLFQTRDGAHVPDSY